MPCGEKRTNMMYGDEPPIYCRLTGVRKTEQEKRDRGINVSNVLGTPIEYTTIETYVGKKIESSWQMTNDQKCGSMWIWHFQSARIRNASEYAHHFDATAWPSLVQGLLSCQLNLSAQIPSVSNRTNKMSSFWNVLYKSGKSKPLLTA